MTKLRIAHVLYQLSTGGAENGIINLVNHIDKNLFEPILVPFVPGGALKKRLDTSTVTLIEELHKRAGNDWRIPIQLARIFRQWRPHIVHTHAWGTLCEGWLAVRLSRVPLWIHGEHGTIEKKKFNKRVQRYLWKKANAVLAVSNVLADQLASNINFPRQQIHPLVNGVDTSRFHPQTKTLSLLKELGINDNNPIIGIIGRLEPVKDHRTFLRALAYAQQHFPNSLPIHALIIGTGSQLQDLQKLTAKLCLQPYVHFLHQRADIPQLLNLLDIFLLSSRSEGMSNTILEAMACGVPVIATEVGGNTELVTNGKTGIMVPPNSPQQMGQAIIHLLTCPALRKTMGQISQQQVNQAFSLQKMVTNYERLYQAVANW